MCVLKKKILIVIAFLTVVACSPAAPQISTSSTPGPILLTDEQEEYPLGSHLQILEDPGGELTFEEVSSEEYIAQFAPSKVESPNLGLTDSAYWLRFVVQNKASAAKNWLLEIAFANIHYVDLYIPVHDGKEYKTIQTGAMRSPDTRDILHPNFVFELPLQTQNPQNIYMRIESGSSTALPMRMWESKTFFVESQQVQVLYWLFYGALIGLLIYNLFLFISLRDINYLYLILAITSMIIFDILYTGFLEVFIFPNLFHLRLYFAALSFAFIFISVCLFTNSFLDLKTHLPKLHLAMKIVLGVWGLLLAIIPFTPYNSLAMLMIPWGLISLVVVLVAGILSFLQGQHAARLFLIAWIGMLVTYSLILVVRLGLIPSTNVTENAFRVGWVWLAVCWSLALADRINQLKAETDASNIELLASENRLSQILEGLPIGVVVYGNDQKPSYANQRTADILSNPERDIQVDISAGRTLSQALEYFSLLVAGSNQDYPIDRLPIYRALQGEQSSVDDIEADLIDRRVPIEIWASPVRNSVGAVESAVVAFQDISQRRQAEAELVEYQQHLEELVEERTSELSTVNDQLKVEIDEREQLEEILQMRLDWLAAINLVNQVMARSADFNEIYQNIINVINQLFASQDSFIIEIDEISKRLKILAHTCVDENHPELVGSFTSLPDLIQTNAMLKQGKVVLFSRDQLSSLAGSIGIHYQGTEIHTIALVPLQLRERVIGYLGVELHDEERVFSLEEITLLEIFSFDIARLIEDSRVFEQTKAMISAEERNRLARDLHDSVTQVLFSATLLAEVLPKIWERDPDKGAESLERLRKQTRGALAEMRTMLLELRPSAVIKTPLSELLAQLTEAITSRSGLPFQLYIEQIPSLPEAVHTGYYRIAQEALNNVVKHAQAQLVSVSLSTTHLPPDQSGGKSFQIRLEIEDDGVGFSPTQDRSDQLGISIMHERANAINAELTIESKPGYGTQVSVTCCQYNEK